MQKNILDVLISWADRFNLPDLEWIIEDDEPELSYWFGFPRNEKRLTTFTTLNISGLTVTFQHL